MVSWAATNYRLVLGARDTTTGWPKQLWTAESINITIEPKGTGRLSMVCGVHTRLDALGFTEFDTRADNVILQNSVHWKVVGEPLRWTVGDKTVYLVVQLSKLLTFPVPMTEPVPPVDSTHFWGFELFADGTGFEEGKFERGWM